MANLTRTWTYTSLSNTSSGNKPMVVTIDKFAVSGDTTSYVATVDSIVINHYHTATKSTSVWPLRVVVTLGDGTTTLTSDTVSHSCNNNIVKWENTISSITNAQAAIIQSEGIKSISIEIVGTAPSGTLYWRAVSQYPISIAMSFGSKVPNAPQLKDVSVSWTKTTNCYAGATIPQFECSLMIDEEMGADYSTMTLSFSYQNTKVSGDPDQITLTTNDFVIPQRVIGEPVTNRWVSGFKNIGPFSTLGTITWTFTAMDTNGKSATSTGTFSVTAYTKPTISTFLIERYVTPYGGSSEASPMGTSVWVSITAGGVMSGSIPMKTGSSVMNTGTIKMSVQSPDGSYYWSKTITTGLAAGSTYSILRSETTDTNTRNTSDSYIYILRVEDAVSYTSATYTLTASTALLNIEKSGIAIGKLVTDGTPTEPIFDVAMKTKFEDDVLLAGYNMNSVTQKATVQISSTSFVAGTGDLQPTISRVGPLVFLNGLVKVASGGVVHTSKWIGEIARVSDWAYPKGTKMFVVSGPNSDFFGKITISQYGYVEIWSQYNSGTIAADVEFYLDCCWIAADAYPAS